jgi:ABC-2 type transport system ATP-binding protein
VKTLSGGRSGGSTSASRSSATPTSSFSTSRRPAFDPAPAATPGSSSALCGALGKTVLLTTHYLDEAQQLADRVAVLARGEIVRMGRRPS